MLFLRLRTATVTSLCLRPPMPILGQLSARLCDVHLLSLSGLTPWATDETLSASIAPQAASHFPRPLTFPSELHGSCWRKYANRETPWIDDSIRSDRSLLVSHYRYVSTN
ncbi:hypothetical protein SISNIDRAFT_176267 [Sistotremastrum niveocremeum HHB9708]|uniref:Uncharacterized protein n=1 Tax=Sistotremastrum niveocremeum HHB9708 TaxID=1314777 RepID=A0A164RQT8_9AGAM|nr:hypothetical protein SISNIDRAFT_176267 [Sistotremastrum niveocremeum HHB9708]